MTRDCNAAGSRRRTLRCRFFGCRYGSPDLAVYSVFGPFCLRCGAKWE